MTVCQNQSSLTSPAHPQVRLLSLKRPDSIYLKFDIHRVEWASAVDFSINDFDANNEQKKKQSQQFPPAPTPAEISFAQHQYTGLLYWKAFELRGGWENLTTSSTARSTLLETLKWVLPHPSSNLLTKLQPKFRTKERFHKIILRVNKASCFDSSAAI